MLSVQSKPTDSPFDRTASAGAITDSSERQRKIIHVDMDAFYASVEQRDNPELRGKPVAVGGSRERGVVAAASYEARKFGVRSAMPSVTAKRNCPDLIFVKPRFDVYKAVSMQIRVIFAEHTPLIEPLSLDEAYLDVTENLQGITSATEIAEAIRAKIRLETGLTASAGVSYNKFLAKLASDHRKTAEAQINAIDDMREAAGRINDLRHERIEKIERDIKGFEADVAALAQAIAPHLHGSDPEEVVLELDRLAGDAARVRDLKAAKDSDIAGVQKKVEECRASSGEAREIIARLQRTAAVSSIDDLRIAIQRSDEMRALAAALDRLTQALTQDGDGLSIADLTAECSGTDLDAVAAKEQTITEEVQELRNRLMEARETRNAARQAFEAVGGDDKAARDAADRQAALAEIAEIAEQYVRLRSAIVLLQWAIDRYRREKQAPLLKRAGELFAILTCGSFKTLQLEFDDHDNMQLAGIREDGRRVPVAGMSSGTADQLYLALRVAAVEDYLDHAEPMPFIADDLFINFDDKRAAAGFRVLGELAKKTQVLFFTHHEHLLEVAREALGAPIAGVTLPVAASPPAQRAEAA